MCKNNGYINCYFYLKYEKKQLLSNYFKNKTKWSYIKY